MLVEAHCVYRKEGAGLWAQARANSIFVSNLAINGSLGRKLERKRKEFRRRTRLLLFGFFPRLDFLFDLLEDVFGYGGVVRKLHRELATP